MDNQDLRKATLRVVLKEVTLHWVLSVAIKKKNTTVDVTSREFCQKRMMCTEVKKVEA